MISHRTVNEGGMEIADRDDLKSNVKKLTKKLRR